MEEKLISVIVPCYNEEEVLPLFYAEIQKVSARMQEAHPELLFEYVFIDDGSKDRTLKLLRDMAKADSRVRFISFSRNFGKEAGIYAGLTNAKGDYCVVMDADLQHPPAFLPTMYEAVASGEYDCATTRRVSRAGESKVRSWFARLFYKIMNKISQTEIVDGAQDFRFMTRQMVDAVLSMSEYNRFSKGIFSWVGFRVKYLEYENVERAAGTTAWSFWGLFRYSIEGIIGFSTFPLTISTVLGIVSCVLALIMFIVTIIKKLAFGEPVSGYPTLICSIVFFGGLQMFCTGILGLYLSKTYLEVKHRPIYIMRENEKNMDQFPDPPEQPAKRLPEKAETAAKRVQAADDDSAETLARIAAHRAEVAAMEETADAEQDDEAACAQEEYAEEAYSEEAYDDAVYNEEEEPAEETFAEPEQEQAAAEDDADEIIRGIEAEIDAAQQPAETASEEDYDEDGLDGYFRGEAQEEKRDYFAGLDFSRIRKNAAKPAEPEPEQEEIPAEPEAEVYDEEAYDDAAYDEETYDETYDEDAYDEYDDAEYDDAAYDDDAAYYDDDADYDGAPAPKPGFFAMIKEKIAALFAKLDAESAIPDSEYEDEQDDAPRRYRSAAFYDDADTEEPDADGGEGSYTAEESDDGVIRYRGAHFGADDDDEA